MNFSSHYHWSDCSGMAYVGLLCTGSSAAVDGVRFKLI